MSQTNSSVCTEGDIEPGDTAWVLMSTVLVLGMMPALSFFEAGLLRSKNTVSILTQVFAGIAMNSVLWFLIGFTLVFGESAGGFIGKLTTYPLFISVPTTSALPSMCVPGVAYAMFQMMFATITPLLITGSFAERLRWRAFFTFTILWEIFVYYPVAHWIWNPEGWLAKLGTVDFAGGIVIHCTAGISSIVAAIKLGPRKDFIELKGHYPPSNVPLFCIGGALLWMGWFGFNAGSALSSQGLAAIVVANTQIGSSAAGLVFLILSWYKHRPSVIEAVNGTIAGLAGITPAAGYIHIQTAFVLGIILGFAGFYSIELIRFRLLIDDALDVSSVHGVTGLVGALAIGFAGANSINDAVHDGVFFGGGAQLGYQIAGIVAASAWALVFTVIIFYVMDKSLKMIKPDGHLESQGLDGRDHAITAYGQMGYVALSTDDHDHDNSHDINSAANDTFHHGSGMNKNLNHV